MLHQLGNTAEAPVTNIMGLYCPADMITRKALYNYVTTNIAHKPGDKFVIGGDFNATVQDLDRHTDSHTSPDMLHRAFLRDTGLSPCEMITAGQPRQYTYRKGWRAIHAAG
jgi:AraC-like DNA-binding protein